MQSGGQQEDAEEAEPLPRGKLCTCPMLLWWCPRLSKGPEIPIHLTLKVLKSFQGRDDGKGDGRDSQLTA